uniref:Protein ARV n=1 Tax=Oryza glumipatula TaxID=40148 RepID=A0A0D9ZE12_9ORYZ
MGESPPSIFDRTVRNHPQLTMGFFLRPIGLAIGPICLYVAKAHQKRAVSSSRLVSSPAKLTDDATPPQPPPQPQPGDRRRRPRLPDPPRPHGGKAVPLSGLSPQEGEEERPRCVGCGRRVKTLYMQYSPGNIRLMKCDTCKAVADPYIECEFMIILIDLILHKTRAYRHLLFNKLRIYSSLDKGVLVLSILTHLVLGDALLGNIVFMTMLFLEVQFILKLSFDIRRYREVLLAVIISSYFKLFLMAMMVWEFPSSVIFFVEISVLSSNTVALRVVTEFSKAHCFGVCFGAHAARYLTERWLLGAP